MSKFGELESVIKSRYPKFTYKFKDEDPIMKFIGKVMFFNKGFLTNYTTTLGQTVYFPNKKKFDLNPDNYFETLCHEYVHVADDSAHPIMFKLKYAFPQILALPAVLFLIFLPIIIPLMIFSVISPLWLFTLLSLIFLAPIPSPGRTQAELRGYGMSLKARAWKKSSDEDMKYYFKKYVEAFTGSGYYFMCPFKYFVSKKLVEYLNSDDCLNDKNPSYRDVYNLINK